jgi:hypothetical protein
MILPEGPVPARNAHRRITVTHPRTLLTVLAFTLPACASPGTPQVLEPFFVAIALGLLWFGSPD